MNESDRASSIHRYDTVFLNGTVGVGKSTLAAALSASETAVHAVIDLDDIRRLSPAPESDRFNHELELANLRSVVVNYRRAGAVRFIVAGVIEDPAEVARYVGAVGADGADRAAGADGAVGMFICRLVASRKVVAERLARRHQAEMDRADATGLAWHLARVHELDRVLSRHAVEDLLLDATTMSPSDLAVGVRRAVGWS